jgi:hypothetical protein
MRIAKKILGKSSRNNLPLVPRDPHDQSELLPRHGAGTQLLGEVFFSCVALDWRVFLAGPLDGK